MKLFGLLPQGAVRGRQSECGNALPQEGCLPPRGPTALGVLVALLTACVIVAVAGVPGQERQEPAGAELPGLGLSQGYGMLRDPQQYVLLTTPAINIGGTVSAYPKCRILAWC